MWGHKHGLVNLWPYWNIHGECHENPSLPKPSMSLRIGREIVLFLWLHSKPFKFALVHKMLPNRNCIWRLNCVEVVVDDRFRKRVLAGCVPSSRGWWQYVITHLDCVKCPPPLINSVLGKKRSQIGLMAWLHTLNVTLKLYFNPRCPPSLSQTVPKGDKSTT